jgi:HPt (histidine-containing phosphotransfer) domain-containing protein
MENRQKPVDLQHLERYTGGDRALDREILGLFDQQCREILERLVAVAKDSGDAKSWREITHTLKGAARGIGAWSLADAAAQAEIAALTDRKGVLECLERIKETSAAVHGFIEEFLQRGN